MIETRKKISVHNFIVIHILVILLWGHKLFPNRKPYFSLRCQLNWNEWQSLHNQAIQCAQSDAKGVTDEHIQAGHRPQNGKCFRAYLWMPRFEQACNEYSAASATQSPCTGMIMMLIRNPCISIAPCSSIASRVCNAVAAATGIVRMAIMFRMLVIYQLRTLCNQLPFETI